jgi:uncharacterized repeat protein (TIGR02543 family)
MKLNNLLGKITLALMVILGLVSCKKPVYYNISASVQPAGSGSVVVTPSAESVLDGTTVTFKATPNGDYLFTGWSGSLSGTTNPATIVASSDLNVTANFTLKTYPLSISVEGEGTVNERIVSTKTEYDSGTVIELTAQPAEHWLFDHWEGDLSGSSNPAQITVSSAKTVKAVFVKKMYDLTVTVEGEGAVSETIIETKSGSYQEGTVVELTAAPSLGWSFDHWEGDLSGTENPSQITVSAAKAVKAVFTKNKYAYNLKIVGPGVVDEFLVEDTKARLDYGTRVILKAIPSEGAVFDGWSGDITSNNAELNLTIDEPKDIIATFSGVAKTYPLPVLKQPWPCLKRLYKEFDFRLFSDDAAGRGWLPIDYNRDGYLDVITTETFKDNYFESDCDIHFYTGNPDGSFSIDPLNDNVLVGKEPRKIMYADFNNDDKPDILLIGHGTEQPDARIGIYPMILMSSSSGTYDAVRFEELWGYYHGGSIGDIDNDGDLDIVLPDAMGCVTHTLLNDGTGMFSVDDTKVLSASGIFTCELYDVNHDGFLDLIWGGGADGKWDGETWRAEVIWGNGHGFLSTNAISIIPNGDLITFLDFEFYDLDHDGIDEIITPITPEHYDSWDIEVYKWTGSNFVSVTSVYFKPGENIGQGESWINNVDLEEVDGKMYLVCQQYGDSRMTFEYNGGMFSRVIEDSLFVPQNGFSIYYDAKAPIDSSSGYDVLCTDNPHSGVSCIKNDPDSWGFSFKLSEAQNGADLRNLVSKGYSLEFYIRHDHPDFLVDIKFLSEAMDGQEGNTFCYGYRGNEHNSDGEWQRIVLPLAELESWDDETKESWGRINALFFHAAGDYNKCPFYVDDIRIRKILPDNL